MRRSGPGLAALERDHRSQLAYHQLSDQLSRASLASLQSQLASFGAHLRRFAAQHRRRIITDATFRHQFQAMCASMGIDPLLSSRPGVMRGVWNELLGLDDWGLELAVQVVDVCVARRPIDGGMTSMQDVVSGVNRLRLGVAHAGSGGGGGGGGGRGVGVISAPPLASSSSSSLSLSAASPPSEAELVTENDVLRALKILRPLGAGYDVVELTKGAASAGGGVGDGDGGGGGVVRMIRSTPRELDTDSLAVFMLLSLPPPLPPPPKLGVEAQYGVGVTADDAGDANERNQQQSHALRHLTVDELRRPDDRVPKPAWSEPRAQRALESLAVREGSLWVDCACTPHRYYAAPGSWGSGGAGGV